MLKLTAFAALLLILPGIVMAEPKPKIIAHRGAVGLAPENTLPAIRAAIDAGSDGGVWIGRTDRQRNAVAKLAPDAVTTDRPDWRR